MTTVSTRNEVAVRLPNTPGALSRPMSAIAAGGAAVLAACSYWDNAGAILLLVTDDPIKTAQALTAEGFPWTESTIVLVGPLDLPAQAAVYGAELAAARVNVLYSYSYESEAGQYFLVFKTSDNNHAVRTLQSRVALAGLAAHRPVAEASHSLPGVSQQICQAEA
jgi:hypothetical protein